MLKVGITGGIGSGKTTVCRIFETLGVPVYYADVRGKEIMITDVNVIVQVKKIIGENAYDEKKQLNTKLISEKVFRNKDLLKQLNAVVHPAVFIDSLKWFLSYQDKLLTIYESAIMFETGSNKLMDKMITVIAPLEERIKRTILRDQVSRQEVMERADKQLPDEEKIKQADFIIFNDHSQSLIDQVMVIYKQLMADSPLERG